MLAVSHLLLVDAVIHEHDLRSAVRRPDHDSLDAALAIPLVLETVKDAVVELARGAIVVDCPEGTWRSHDANSAWTIRTSPWEAFRALSSRRTVSEL